MFERGVREGIKKFYGKTAAEFLLKVDRLCNY